jgi:putative transposase
MDERLKFIARLLDGEKMAGLCREFGISRCWRPQLARQRSSGQVSSSRNARRLRRRAHT